MDNFMLDDIFNKFNFVEEKSQGKMGGLMGSTVTIKDGQVGMH